MCNGHNLVCNGNKCCDGNWPIIVQQGLRTDQRNKCIMNKERERDDEINP